MPVFFFGVDTPHPLCYNENAQSFCFSEDLMLNKIKVFTEKYAIIAAFLSFILIDLVLHGVSALLKLLPDLLALKFLSQAILIAIPIAIVFLFGFRSAFQRKNFFRGLFCGLPMTKYQLYFNFLLLII